MQQQYILRRELIVGKEKRMAKIFRNDGNAIITAFDHGGTDGPVPGIIDIDVPLRQVIEAGTDAVITNIGVAKKCGRMLADTGLILRVDYPCTKYAIDTHDSELCLQVEDAVRVGADAVIFSSGPDVGGKNNKLERALLKMLTVLERECHRYGMVLIAEMYPGGWNPPAGAINIESLTLSARLAAEWGADALKMPYRKGYEEVVKGTWLPVVVLGGEKASSEREFFSQINDAMKAGANGVAIGRNIWGNKHPDRAVKLLKALIHEGKDFETAMACLND